MKAYEVKRRGKQSDIIETVSGKTIWAYMLPKAKVEIVIEDKDAKEAVAIVIKTACTNTIGDGKSSSPQLTMLQG